MSIIWQKPSAFPVGKELCRLTDDSILLASSDLARYGTGGHLEPIHDAFFEIKLKMYYVCRWYAGR